MTESSDRFRRVASTLTSTIAAVPHGAWSKPSPCPDWTALDVVQHVVDWFSEFLLTKFDVRTKPAPPVSEDPDEAWAAVRDAIQLGLDDPVMAQRVEHCGPPGEMSFQSAIDMLFTSDVLIHTWDLAQAVGVPVVLDPEQVLRQCDGVLATPPEVDALMRSSGYFGPRVSVSDDADSVTKLLAFYGRRA